MRIFLHSKNKSALTLIDFSETFLNNSKLLLFLCMCIVYFFQAAALPLGALVEIEAVAVSGDLFTIYVEN